MNDTYEKGFWIRASTIKGTIHWTYIFKNPETGVYYKTIATQTIPEAKDYADKSLFWRQAPTNTAVVTSEVAEEFKKNKFSYSRHTLSRADEKYQKEYDYDERVQLDASVRSKFYDGKIKSSALANILKVQWFCSSVLTWAEINKFNTKLLEEQTQISSDLPNELKLKLGFHILNDDALTFKYNASIKNEVLSSFSGLKIKADLDFSEDYISKVII